MDTILFLSHLENVSLTLPFPVDSTLLISVDSTLPFSVGLKLLITTINRNDKSTSISTQMDSLIPASKISNLSQGMFVGAVSDNFDEKIEQKIFHAEIVVDSNKVQNETKDNLQIAKIANFVNNKGEDTMKANISENYSQIKKQVHQIIAIELERISNDTELQYLVKK